MSNTIEEKRQALEKATLAFVGAVLANARNSTTYTVGNKSRAWEAWQAAARDLMLAAFELGADASGCASEVIGIGVGTGPYSVPACVHRGGGRQCVQALRERLEALRPCLKR